MDHPKDHSLFGLGLPGYEKKNYIYIYIQYMYNYIHTLSIYIRIYIYTFIPHTRHTPKLHVRQQVYKQIFLDFIEPPWVGWLLRHWSESGLSIGSPCFAPMVTSMAITDGKNSCDMLRQIATDVVGWEVPRGFMLMMAYEHIIPLDIHVVELCTDTPPHFVVSWL